MSDLAIAIANSGVGRPAESGKALPSSEQAATELTGLRKSPLCQSQCCRLLVHKVSYVRSAAVDKNLV